MNRYDSKEWKELVSIQNTLPHTDILTITGFMDNVQFMEHLETQRKRVKDND